MIKRLAVLPFLALLGGCSVITYTHTYPDGQQYKISGFAFGTTKSIEDFHLTSGDKSVIIGKYGEDQAKAVGAAVEAAVKAAVLAVKP